MSLCCKKCGHNEVTNFRVGHSTKVFLFWASNYKQTLHVGYEVLKFLISRIGFPLKEILRSSVVQVVQDRDIRNTSSSV